MWVIIDWTDTQVIGPFHNAHTALQWLKDYHNDHTPLDDHTFPGLDKLECSIHKVVGTGSANIRLDA